MAKESLKDRLAKKRKKLKETGSGKLLYIKADTTMRVRVLPVGDEEEFVKEVTQFYLGSEIKGVFSPVTIGQPCAIMEAYNTLKSGDEDDKDIAKTMIPKTRYLMPVVVYDDAKGKKINKDRSGKLVQLTKGLYQSILDLYLDDDEWGDMTDVKKGYDIKLTREGSGMTDTEYSVKPCKNTPLDKEWRKQVNLDEMVDLVIPSYEETEENIQDFLGLEKTSSDDKKDKPKSKGKSKKVKSKKKKRKSDI
jgi:hypothetical protein